MTGSLRLVFLFEPRGSDGEYPSFEEMADGWRLLSCLFAPEDDLDGWKDYADKLRIFGKDWGRTFRHGDDDNVSIKYAVETLLNGVK